MNTPKNPAPASDGSNGATAPSDAPANGAPEARAPDPPSSAPAPELTEATPDEKLAALAAERDETKDRMLRIAADFENWKKRAQKEQTDKANEARERVLKNMLEVTDTLERAVAMQASAGGKGVDGPAVLKGVDLVLRLFQQKLERYEVRPCAASGHPFDPRVHEAISKMAHPEIPAGSVAAELQKGYRVGERLLRPALVSGWSGHGQ